MRGTAGEKRPLLARRSARAFPVTYASSSTPEEAAVSTDAIVSREHLFVAPPAPGDEALDDLKYRVTDKLTQQLDLAELRRLPDDRRRSELRLVAARFLAAEGTSLSPEARAGLLDEILDELVGLGPLDKLLREPGAGDILVNGPHNVWVEKAGQLQQSAVRFRDDDHLMQVLERIVSRVGRR